ncbi:MAG: hypothetical protein ACTSX8_09075, partial [Alphaproteobacteria bacterium]
RGKLKAKGPAVFILLAALATPSVGCAKFDKGLAESFAVLKGVSVGGEREFRTLCDRRAIECRDQRRKAEALRCTDAACITGQQLAIATARACAPLRKCHAQRKLFDELIVDGHALIRAAKAASTKNVNAILEEVSRLVTRARETIVAARALGRGGA